MNITTQTGEAALRMIDNSTPPTRTGLRPSAGWIGQALSKSLC
ncbi:hypothetical protein [Acidisarcina polymorpha]|nr:hypothetical protein [Acidisarcina polymorpha]